MKIFMGVMKPGNPAISAALLHDWLIGFRGGERVFEAMCELLPDAPVHTLIYKPGTASTIIESHPIYTSFLDSVPGIYKNYRKYLPLFPLAAASLKLDPLTKLVLSSSHCVIKGVKKPPGSIHVSYIHSPMRYMYDQYDQYFGPHAPALQRVGAWACRKYLTDWDKSSNDNVDVLVANSAFVRERIKKFYGREAVVIHPFVDLEDFRHLRSAPRTREDYYVVVSAFAPNKRVDLAILATVQLGRRLKIIGSGQLEKELKSIAGSHVEFLGQLSRDEVIDTVSRARGFLFPGIEDFGITPLEALAAGTPVIAYKAGGAVETLTENDSVFFTEPTVESLMDGIRRFEKMSLSPSFERLEAFSKPRFKRELTELLTNVLE